jgi:Fibronectin type III domain
MRSLLQIIISISLVLVTCWPPEVRAAQSVTLAWDPNLDPTIAGYRLYYGTSSGVYTQQIEVGNTTATLVSNLADGQTYFFAVTAYNAAGAESTPSNEVSYTAPGSVALSIGVAAVAASMSAKAAPAPALARTPIPRREATWRFNYLDDTQTRWAPHGGSIEAAAYARWCGSER